MSFCCLFYNKDRNDLPKKMSDSEIEDTWYKIYNDSIQYSSINVEKIILYCKNEKYEIIII